MGKKKGSNKNKRASVSQPTTDDEPTSSPKAKKPSVLGSIMGGGRGGSFSFLTSNSGGGGGGSELERARKLLCQGGAAAENEAAALLEGFVADTAARQAAPGVLAMFSPQRFHAEALVELGKLCVGRGDVSGAVGHFEEAFELAQVAESYLWAAKALRQAAPSQSVLEQVRSHLEKAVQIGEQASGWAQKRRGRLEISPAASSSPNPMSHPMTFDPPPVGMMTYSQLEV